MENPYAASPSPFAERYVPEMPQERYPRGLVGHVRVLGILMIVQGALNLMMALMLLAMAVAFPLLIAQQRQANPNLGQPNGADTFLSIMYGSIGGGMFLLGVLTIWSGWRVTQFRQRVLGIVTLSIGMASVFSCYCSFTALALLIYGLIVLLDGSVKRAFELSREGFSPAQIEAIFNPWTAAGALNLPTPPPKQA